MAKIKVKEIQDKQAWEEYVLDNNPDSFLQSWNWGEVNNNLGDRVIRKGFYVDDNLCGVMQMIKKSARRGAHFIIPGGPLIDFSKPELRKSFINEINIIANKEKVWFVRVRPELHDNMKNRARLRDLGFIRAPMHLHAENTWILPIDRSDDDILYDMRKNTRYSVRKSLKQGLKLEITADPESSNVLYELQKVTAKRHGFVGFSRRLFEEQIKIFGEDDQAKLFLVKDKNGEVHVAAIIIFYGDTAYYHHSASSRASRDNYSSYFLQWKVIQEAREIGCKKYNLWGVSPDSSDEKHRFFGVTVFKSGFGGHQVDWLPAHDYRTNKLYWLTYGFEHLRKLRRGL